MAGGGGGGWDDVDVDVTVGGGVLGPVVGWAVVVGGVSGELGLGGGVATAVTHILCACVCVFWSMGRKTSELK